MVKAADLKTSCNPLGNSFAGFALVDFSLKQMMMMMMMMWRRTSQPHLLWCSIPKQNKSATAAGFEPTKEFPRGLHDVFKSAALTTRPDSRNGVAVEPKIVAGKIFGARSYHYFEWHNKNQYGIDSEHFGDQCR